MARELTLVEIDYIVDSQGRYGKHEVEAPGGDYLPLLLNVGGIDKSIPNPPSMPETADLSIELANTSLEFSKRKAQQDLVGLTVRIKRGLEGEALASFRTRFTGRIVDDEFSEFKVRLLVQDTTGDPFKKKVPGAITSSEFPGLPSDDRRLWKIKPKIFGSVSSVGRSGDGFVPCPQIKAWDGSTAEFLVADHACSDVAFVYRYGELLAPSQYSVVEFTVGGQKHTKLVFTFNPIDEFRSFETAITADVDGITDDRTSSGTLITNPARAFEAYVLDYIPELDAADLDSVSFQTAADRYDELGLTCAGAIVTEINNRDVFQRFAESFNLFPYHAEDGKLAVQVLEGGDNPPSGTASFGTDVINRVPRFRSRSNREPVNRYRYNHSFNFAKQVFFRRPQLDDLTTQSGIGIIERDLNLYFVNDQTQAEKVATARMHLSRPAVDEITFMIPEPLASGVGLTNFIRVTAPEGPELQGSGYVDTPFMVTDNGLQVGNLGFTIGARKLPAVDIWTGSGFANDPDADGETIPEPPEEIPELPIDEIPDGQGKIDQVAFWVADDRLSGSPDFIWDGVQAYARELGIAGPQVDSDKFLYARIGGGVFTGPETGHDGETASGVDDPSQNFETMGVASGTKVQNLTTGQIATVIAVSGSHLDISGTEFSDGDLYRLMGIPDRSNPYIRYNYTLAKWEFFDGEISGAATPIPDEFIELVDTPSTYSGDAFKFPRVNSEEDGLEFVSAQGLNAAAIKSAHLEQSSSVLDQFYTILSFSGAGYLDEVIGTAEPASGSATEDVDFRIQIDGGSVNILDRDSAFVDRHTFQDDSGVDQHRRRLIFGGARFETFVKVEMRGPGSHTLHGKVIYRDEI